MLDASLDIALDFLRAHPQWFIFPITRLEKDPPLIKDNLNQASNDPKQIRMWHQKWRGCNWGLALRKSGVIVMDVDRKAGKIGQATLDNLILEFGDLPETLTVMSPSGGLHYYFTGVHRFGLGKYGFGPDIDSPNYVLIPGCWLCSNSVRGYETITDTSVAEAPKWFGEFLKEKAQAEAAPDEAAVDLDKPANIERMVRYLQEGAPLCRQGSNGNKTLFDVSCVLKDNGISEGMAVKLLQTWYNVEGKCEPLWNVGVGADADRLDIVVRNAYRYAGENQAGTATAEFAFGDPADAIDPKEVADYAAMWNKLKAKQDRTKKEAADAKVEARWTEEAKGFDPITGDAITREPNIDPLTGDPFDEPPPGSGAAPKDPPQADKEETVETGFDASTLPPMPPKSKQDRDWVRANWVWVVGMERFIRIRDGVMWSAKQFDSYYNNLVTTASVAGTLFKQDSIRKVEKIVYRPGRAVLLDGGKAFNLWRPSGVKPKEGDTSMWNEHLNYLFQNEEDRDLVLNWMAWVYQNPSRKPNHGLLIVGRNTGTGKSFVARILEQLVGPENTQRPKNSSLKGDFNAWALQCKLCIIEELMQTGRRDVANELRDTITESTIEVNIKNVNAQKTENYAAMLAITNHRDPIPMDDTERRWLVIETFADRREGDYYKRLWAILDDPKALAAIAYELKNRDLGEYSGLLAPRETQARSQMIDLSRSDVETWLVDNSGSAPLNGTLIAIQDIINNMPGPLQRTPKLNAAVRTYVRDKLGGELIRSVRVGPEQRVRLWALRGKATIMAQMTDAQLAEKYRMGRTAAGRSAEEEAADDFAE